MPALHDAKKALSFGVLSLLATPTSPVHLLPRLVSQLAQKEADHLEAMSALQVKQNLEVKTLKEVLGGSEAANTDLQKEVN